MILWHGTGQIFLFSGKHLSPRLQKQHICFAARLGFIAFQGRQSQTNTFSSQRYTFSSCSLLVFSFFKLLSRAFWNMILQHQHLSEGRLHFKLLHLRKMLKRHDLATKMRWATVQEKWKWTVTKKNCPYSGIKKWKWNTSGNYCPCAILNLIKERIEINFGTYA